MLHAGSPFFPAVYALEHGHQVASGTTVRGCVVQAFTTCKQAKLRGADLQGVVSLRKGAFEFRVRSGLQADREDE